MKTAECAEGAGACVYINPKVGKAGTALSGILAPATLSGTLPNLCFATHRMKKLLPIVLLLSLCFAACNKKDDTTADGTTPAVESDHTPASDGDPAFTISGVRDIDLGAAGKGSITIPLSILQTSGRNRDTVSL